MGQFARSSEEEDIYNDDDDDDDDDDNDDDDDGNDNDKYIEKLEAKVVPTSGRIRAVGRRVAEWGELFCRLNYIMCKSFLTHSFSNISSS